VSRLLTVAAVAVLAAVVTAPLTGVIVVTTETPTDTPTDDGSLVKPGDRLQGVVGVQEAEVDGDIRERAFDLAFTEAETNASKAAAVSAQVSDLESRIASLENEREALRTARDNGSIDESEFRARMAVLAAEAATARRLANGTANATRQVPADALAEQGVDPESVQSLGRRASNLTGQEAAAIARSVAGNGVGRRVAGRNRPNVTGPPDGVPGRGNGNGTDRPGGGNGQGNATDRPGGGNGGANAIDRPGGGNGGRNAIDRPGAVGAVGLGEVPAGDATLLGSEVPAFVAPAGPADSPGPLAVTETEEGVPLFTVGLQPTDPASVTLQLTFDLTTDADRQAFETLQGDEDARADVRDRFQGRMASVADSAESRVDRDMTVSDAEISLSTSEDGDTGIVTLSVVWAELAGRAGDAARPNIAITEPFASGFTPSREFTVRVLAPEEYRLTRVNPAPMRQTNTSAAWAAGTSLEDFLLEFTPEEGTPLPSAVIEGFEPESPETTDDGGGLSGSALSVGVLLVVAVAIGGYLAWQRREAD
jgi:hypothetical protein